MTRMSETALEKEPFTQKDVEETIQELESNTLNTEKVARTLGFLLNQVNELKSDKGFKGGLQENPANLKINTEASQNDLPSSPTHIPLLSAGERAKWETDLSNGSPQYIHDVIIGSDTSVRVQELAWNVLLGRSCVTANTSSSLFNYIGTTGIEVDFSYDGKTLSLPKKGTNEIITILIGKAAEVAWCLSAIDKSIQTAQSEPSLYEQPFMYDSYTIYLRIKKISKKLFSNATKEKEIIKEVVGYREPLDNAKPPLTDYLNNRWKHLPKSKEGKTD